MKVGDLVIMDRDPTIGIVIDTPMEGTKTGILWPDGDGRVDYEPTNWLKVICGNR
jgi:hypothetical protein